ncbi:FtsX-like permease family protein [Lipingzhangella sp. LS1_29]|uniref:FtsX-like permease family protein n=1 Tax=Lipingzhangella rawalii TaxID=2055835 RepID=A0ABU2H226_9ACTN|nr:FtsX-like permease family protein [Lipingzhangella rawalii]MDS1268914.1 FtsX-like permease family protein [Lipingzhangella rawalii]
MLRTTLAGLRLHKGRLVTTVLAIALGVLFVSGTLVFTDSLRTGFEDTTMGATDRLASVVLPDTENWDPQSEEEPRLTPTLRDDIADLPEVGAATGIISGDAPLLDQDGQALGQVPTAGLSVTEDTRYSPETGTLPSAADEVALATTTAEQTGFDVGDTVEVLDPEGQAHAFTVTGLIDVSIGDPYLIRGAVAFTESTAVTMTGHTDYSEINVRAAADTPDAEVTTAVEDAVGGPGVEVLSGTEMGERLAESGGADAATMNMALLLFALVSVAVAGLVVYNTFAILLAQRQRELALLRCVGAHRGQVLRGVLLEAFIVGLTGATLGVLGGIGVGYVGFYLGGDSFGAAVSASSLTVSPVAIGAGLSVGLVTTMAAALVPALRATRVSPLAALRSSAVAHGLERRAGWLRSGAGLLLGLVSATMLWLALGSQGGQTAMLLVTLAGMVAFLAVVVLGPLLVRGAIAGAEVPIRRLGVASRLAVDNAGRSPKRAATAMLALTVGATLITGYAVINASVERTLLNQLDEQFPADYTITQQFDLSSPEQANEPGDGETNHTDTDTATATAVDAAEGVAPAVVSALEDAPEVDTVFSELRATAPGLEAGQRIPVSAYLGATVGTDLTAEVEAGELTDLGPGRAVISEDHAGSHTVGDTVQLDTERGETELEIVAVVGDMQQLWGLTMAPDQFTEEFPSVTEATAVNVRADPDADPADVRDVVYEAAEDPTLQVTSTAEARSEFTEILDTAFLAVAAMLGLSVLIAVFGIANTMALSVLERSRESALLRALGLSRSQLRRMLVVEAVLLCVIGSGIGIGLGVLFGWAAGAVTLPSMLTVIPWSQIAMFLGIAVLAGIIAAILPSRRASRTSVTSALARE